MKKIMIILLVVFAWGTAYAQDENVEYRAISKDGEMTSVLDVKVGRWTPIEYTVRQCDEWIEEWKRRKKECAEHHDKQIEIWETIREAVFKEADKVQLKSH